MDIKLVNIILSRVLKYHDFKVFWMLYSCAQALLTTVSVGIVLLWNPGEGVNFWYDPSLLFMPHKFSFQHILRLGQIKQKSSSIALYLLYAWNDNLKNSYKQNQ